MPARTLYSAETEISKTDEKTHAKKQLDTFLVAHIVWRESGPTRVCNAGFAV